jgi:hypothetical protein
MKKLFLSILLLSLFTCTIFAQDILSKVPSGATMVIKYAGGNLTQKLPAKKFETYALLKKKFLNAFLPDKNFTLESTGLNLQQDAYQYLLTTDSTTSFVTLVSISNAEKFRQFILQNNKANLAIPSQNGFQLYQSSSNRCVGWNGDMAAVVLTYYTSKRYYQPAEAVADTAKMYDGVGKMTPYSDTSIALEKMPVTDTAATSTGDTITIDSAAVAAEPEETPQQKAEKEASELFYAQQAIIKDSIQKGTANNILQSLFGPSTNSVKEDISFAKLVDKNADISLWLDSSNLMGKLPSMYGGIPYKYNYNLFPGFSQAVNVFFEKDKVMMEQQIFVGNKEDAQLFKNIYNSKQNPAFINYLQPGDIGFVSISVNSEALMHSYYGIAKKIMKSTPYIGKESDLIDACVDILEIVIDEKAIADVLPGNGLIVLHGVKPRKVKYISYDYDANYNAKEATKTKTETSPDFSFIFETRNENIFNKLINLPIKLNKDSGFNYTRTGDFYTLVLGEKNIIEKLYFKVKDGRCIITTSLTDVNGPIPNNNLDAATKQSFLNSNYYGNINFKSLISCLSSDVTDKKNKKMISYLQANAGNMTFESTINNDLIKTTALFNITGKHTNSLEYFFNVIENLLKIEAGDKK